MREEESPGQSGENQDCIVKNKAKNFIRQLRNIESKPVDEDGICGHKGTQMSEYEKQILFKMWYNKFKKSFAGKLKSIKIDQNTLYKAFREAVEADQNIYPILQSLKEYLD